MYSIIGPDIWRKILYLLPFNDVLPCLYMRYFREKVMNNVVFWRVWFQELFPRHFQLGHNSFEEFKDLWSFGAYCFVANRIERDHTVNSVLCFHPHCTYLINKPLKTYTGKESTLILTRNDEHILKQSFTTNSCLLLNMRKLRRPFQTCFIEWYNYAGKDTELASLLEYVSTNCVVQHHLNGTRQWNFSEACLTNNDFVCPEKILTHMHIK